MVRSTYEWDLTIVHVGCKADLAMLKLVLRTLCALLLAGFCVIIIIAVLCIM